MYKIVAADMDETFLNTDHAIPEANLQAVARMHDLGVRFVPASGRPYPSIMDSIAAIPAEYMQDSYVISYNGGTINRYGDPRPLMQHTIPWETVKRIYDWGLTRGVGFHIYEQSGKVWASHLPQSEYYYLAGHMPFDEFDDNSLSFLRDIPLAKILYVKPDGLDYLRKLAGRMPQDVYRGTSLTYSSNRYLEFVPRNVDKGFGLKVLLAELDIDRYDVIAIGDSQNDLPMLETAGLGVTVANAAPGVAALADYNARATNDDGVLAEVLQKFIEPQHQA